MSNVLVESSVLRANFLKFTGVLRTNESDYFEIREKRLIQYLNFTQVNATQSIFNLITDKERNPLLRQIDYFVFENLNIQGLRMMGQNDTSTDRSVTINGCPAFFALKNTGIKVYQSLFEEITLLDGHIIRVDDKMVPLWIENNSFTNFLGESRKARFFWKVQTDLDQEIENNTLFSHYPVLSAFCLINNVFSGNWAFESAPQIFTLNVPNAFILNNSFTEITFSTAGSVFSVKKTYCNLYSFIHVKFDPERFERNVIEPELRGLYETYANQQSSETNVLSILVFSHNYFDSMTISNHDLVAISALCPGLSLFLFDENIFSEVKTPKMKGYLENSIGSRVVSISENELSVIKGNLITDSMAWLTFFELTVYDLAYSEFIFEDNIFMENYGISVLSITGEEFGRIELLRNQIRNSNLNYDTLINVVVSSKLWKDLLISGNVLDSVHLISGSYSQESLIHVSLRSNDISKVILSNFTMTDCSVELTHQNKISGPRNALISFMIPKSILVIEASLIKKTQAIGATYVMMIYSGQVDIRELDFHENPGFRLLEENGWESSILISSDSFLLSNSRMSQNIGTNGGVFSIENLLSTNSSAMTVVVTNNTFLKNQAVNGGVFYFNTDNYKPLRLQLMDNVFIQNRAYEQGGTMCIKRQAISLAEVRNSYFDFEDSVFYHSSLFHIERLTQEKRGQDESQPSFLIENTTVRSKNFQKFASLNQRASLITFNNERNYFFEMKLLISGFNFINLLDPDIFPASEDADLNLIFILGEAGNLIIRQLNVTGVSNSRHIIQMSSDLDLWISESTFERNYFISNNDQYFVGACVIELDTSEKDTRISSKIVISNTTFSQNKFHGGEYQGSLVCIRSPGFDISVVNNTRVTGNWNGFSVFLSTLNTNFFAAAARKVIISDSIFEKNEGVTEHGSVISLEKVDLTIENSSFINNNGAHRGGAISIIDPSRMNITGSTFAHNRALRDSLLSGTSGGGAIYIDFSSSDSEALMSKHHISGCEFDRNMAAGGQGGAIFVDTTLNTTTLFKFMTENLFYDNTASAGGHISTPPASMKLRIEGKRGDNTFPSVDLTNYQMHPELIHGYYFQGSNMLFIFHDIYGHSLFNLAEVTFHLPNYTLSVTHTHTNDTYSTRNCNYGWCAFSGDVLEVKGQAYETIWINSTLSLDNYANVSFTLRAQLRPCQIGEVNSTSKSVCIRCEPNTYSFNPLESICHECPDGFNCFSGGSDIQLKQGFWRVSNTSNRALQCTPKELCNSTVSDGFGDELCSEGYAGPLCLGCDLKNNYANGMGMSCAKCLTSWLAVLPMLGYNLGLFAFEIWYIWRMIKINTAIIFENRFKQEYLEKLARGAYLSIFLQYAQIFTIIKSLPSFAFQYVKNLLPVSNPSQTVFYSIDCTLLYLGVPYDMIYFQKIAIIGGLPFGKILFFALFGVLKKLLSKDFHFKSYLTVVLICITHIEQPGIIFNMISMFSCNPLQFDDSSLNFQYLTISPTVTCGTPVFEAYKKFVAIPSLILWGLCIPAVLFVVLYINRKRLNRKEFAIYFGSYYSGFTRKHYMWRLVQMFIAIMLTILSQLGTMGATSRGLTIVLFLVIYLLYLKSAKPYRFGDVYKTDIIATSIYIITVYFAVYGSISEKWVNIAAGIIILAINACFIIFVIMKSLALVGLQKLVSCVARALNHCFCGMLWDDTIDPSDYRRINASDSIASKGDSSIFGRSSYEANSLEESSGSSSKKRDSQENSSLTSLEDNNMESPEEEDLIVVSSLRKDLLIRDNRL